jgi:hypothetical protein
LKKCARVNAELRWRMARAVRSRNPLARISTTKANKMIRDLRERRRTGPKARAGGLD